MISENEFKRLTESVVPKVAVMPLTKGYWATVDATDLEWLSQWKWSASVNKSAHTHRVYAFRGERQNGVTRCIAMHRQIAAVIGLGDVDHKDGDGLNNCRENLRPADRSHNNANSRKRGGSPSSQYKGVFFHRQTGRWCAQICQAGKKLHLGLFDSEEAAAAAYGVAAVDRFGSFARLA